MKKYQIDKAIAFYSMWKALIEEAIETWESELTSEKLRSTDKCDFGKWLTKDILPQDQKAGIITRINEMHNHLHRSAVKVVYLTLSINKEGALMAMDEKNGFTSISKAFIEMLIQWREN